MDNRELRMLLIRRLQATRVADILSVIAKQRITSRGSDIGGYADLWANQAQIEVTEQKRGKTIKKVISHYRAGGTPLYDTGNLFNSLKGVTKPLSDGAALVLQGSMIALLQSRGFRTTGPNWIPFTRRAMKQRATMSGGGKSSSRRSFATSNPDGLLVARGVTVPARPLFKWPTTARRMVARAIARAMKAR